MHNIISFYEHLKISVTRKYKLLRVACPTFTTCLKINGIMFAKLFRTILPSLVRLCAIWPTQLAPLMWMNFDFLLFDNKYTYITSWCVVEKRLYGKFGVLSNTETCDHPTFYCYVIFNMFKWWHNIMHPVE